MSDELRRSESLGALRAVRCFVGADEVVERLADASERVTFDVGDVVLDHDHECDAVLVVGHGTVHTFDHVDGEFVARDRAGVGSLIGASRAVVSELRAARVVAGTPGWLLRVPRVALEDASDEHPALYEGLAELARAGLRRNLLRAALPRVLGTLDAETLAECERRITWVTVRRGEALFRQGDPADAWYIVASGRLSMVVTQADGVEEVLGEAGRGECVGEAALLSDVPRTASAYAVRDTELMRLRAEDVEHLVERNPRVALSFARALVRRALNAPDPSARAAPRLNITVVLARPDVDDDGLARKLSDALVALGPVLHLDSEPLASRATIAPLADLPGDHPSWLRFSAWLDERAAGCRFVVLEGDPQATPWTVRALHEADEVLIVADATHPPAPSAHERALFPRDANRHHARRTLVLLHPPGTKLPSGTAAWLDPRSVERHLHVRRGHAGDLARLARSLGGAAVCLVLGAGGARGFAHVVTLRALEEAAVPADHIGGTSFGALVGALHAMGVSPAEMLETSRRVVRMRPFADYALPVTSVLRGRRVERVAAMLFGDVAIEDLWLPFFCNSCDISTFRDVTHDRGSVASAVLASSALPGVLPPQVREGRLHVDGGTTDMLIGAAMRARAKGPMIAVDVSTEREWRYAQSQYPTSWAALWRRMRRREPVPLSLPELFMRAVSFGVARRTAEVARDADLFLRPPVERFGTVDIHDMEEIEAIGYAHAREKLAGFRWSRGA